MRNFKDVNRIIVKVGSSSLVNNDFSVNENVIDGIMKNFKALKDMGVDPAFVTSGAIAIGMHELGFTKRPSVMSVKQACAAVGQAKLMEAYNQAAKKYGLVLGQILINHDDFQIRKRMISLSDTLDSMFKNGIIPVINENDALAVDEIKVGDNDTLSALIAPMINANLLVLFSDIDGLYTKNPKVYNDAKLISEVEEISDDILAMVGGATSAVGTGGMETKINAALISTSASIDMIICNSNRINDLVNILKGDEIGTLFLKKKDAISSRDHWMIYKANSQGKIIVDDGLANKLSEKKVSILPKGIKGTVGEFFKGTIIDIIDTNGNLIGKGITNYSSLEINSIKGLDSSLVSAVLNVASKKEVIHANDLVITKGDIYGYFVK